MEIQITEELYSISCLSKNFCNWVVHARRIYSLPKEKAVKLNFFALCTGRSSGSCLGKPRPLTLTIILIYRTYNPRQKSLKHLCTSLSPCNVEMLLQSCVATTTLQKGGGKQKGAEFSKVFQGFCLRL